MGDKTVAYEPYVIDGLTGKFIPFSLVSDFLPVDTEMPIAQPPYDTCVLSIRVPTWLGNFLSYGWQCKKPVRKQLLSKARKRWKY